HDNRAAFRNVFPDVPTDANGFVQYTEDVPAGRFLYLDTVGATHAGFYDAPRRAWLEAELARARADGVTVYLFMHHNPAPVGVRSADIIGMVEGRAFREIIGRNRDIIRHIFFGHCHYVLAGSVAGVPMSAPRSTNHPCVPEFARRQAMGYGVLPPTYDVCLIHDDYVAVHSIDFLAEESGFQWEPISDEEWIDQTGEAA
ncbi:MAG TPA: phosphodiesterase, partial [Pararhizobium sp.]|nr:phosphodiesterase [Pararhizobium sp.]